MTTKNGTLDFAVIEPRNGVTLLSDVPTSLTPDQLRQVRINKRVQLMAEIAGHELDIRIQKVLKQDENIANIELAVAKVLQAIDLVDDLLKG